MNRKLAIVFFLSFLLFCDSSKRFETFKYTHFALGTVIDITLLVESKNADRVSCEDTAKAIARKVFGLFDKIDSTFYEGNRKSKIYQFNTNLPENRFLSVSYNLLSLIKRGIEISRKTDSLFDITVGTYLPLYPFDKERKYSPNIDSLRFLSGFTGFQNILLDTENYRIARKNGYLRLSMGGIAKGYAVDKAINLVSKYSIIKGAIVNAGGDMGLLPRADGKPWRIGIRHPRKPGELLGVVEIKKGAIATSGDYEKFYILNGTRYHHILNPKTGLPAYKCQSVTVIAPNAETADALATGLFVAGIRKGKKILERFPGCHALWVDSLGTVYTSKGFNKFLSEKSW
ncbi:MAG: hypothetical protein DRP91_01235 [Candidatus Neomarinimicrobiota bacterium]|nr:MAG: hypothetical protein DRP91_01235 [Candidatus Neomarinimicrobiota bacterium]